MPCYVLLLDDSPRVSVLLFVMLMTTGECVYVFIALLVEQKVWIAKHPCGRINNNLSWWLVLTVFRGYAKHP